VRAAQNEETAVDIIASASTALRHVLQQPAMAVLGVLVAGGATKTGYGGWTAGAILTSVSMYFGVMLTVMLTRSVRTWIVRVQGFQSLSS
jgi:hypothetical protein